MIVSPGVGITVGVPRLLLAAMWKVNGIWDNRAYSRCEPDSVEVGEQWYYPGLAFLIRNP
jgi:hypothetical protein